MKKLLALILCVMMFISVIPTMAFAEEPEPAGEAEEAAGYPWIDNPLMALAQYKKEIENMVKNTKGNIQDAFAELAANRVVYSTAKGMDDTIVGLVDAITKDLIGKKIPVMKNDGSAVDDPEYLFLKADADNVKDLIRLVIDEKVTKSMADNEFKFVNEYNDDGSIKSIDPIKYAQAFGKAVSDALTNKDFQKGYEAVATYFALASLIKDVNKQLKDEYAAFYGSTVSPKFDEDFTEKYPMLTENYIDTLEEGLDPAFWAWAGVTEYPVVPDNGWTTRDAK